jgi:hypothetical protein
MVRRLALAGTSTPVLLYTTPAKATSTTLAEKIFAHISHFFLVTPIEGGATPILEIVVMTFWTSE